MNQFTKSEFQSLLIKQKKFASKRARIGWISLLLFIGASVLAEKSSRFIADHRLIFGSIFLALLVIIAGFTIIPMFQHMRKIGLVCPYCGQLLDRYRSEAVLKNSKCQKCDNVIIK
jgi:hypothetical protein